MSWVRYKWEDNRDFIPSLSQYKNRKYSNILIVDLVVNTEK